MRLLLSMLPLLIFNACAPRGGFTPPAARVEEATVATTVAFTEGPTADDAGNVYFTEIMNQRILRMTPNGQVSIFREPSNAANGLVIDAEGRLVACEGAAMRGNAVHGKSHLAATAALKPRVTRTDLKTGAVEVLADNYEGKAFNGPNDVTFDGQGRLYFTDLPGAAVYRIDRDKKLTRLLVAPEVQRPNGISITPDDKTLYLVEANGAQNGARLIRAYDLQPDGSLKNMRIHYSFYPGRSADGLCMDTQGNLYAAAGLHQRRGTSETLDTQSGIHVINSEGQRIRFVSVPEDTITNCTFGGPDWKTLYVTAGKGLYTVKNEIAGTRR
ncbi:MAG: SMP-30/gluconolactonase/LRE family protein [Bryobacteraceae bacterium]|nr:SMP-30/gluconolactonase/LRE family protein [Bryobacteraceae bacterium]